jgi:hypothetical protein
MTPATVARRRREQAAAAFRPERIETLLVSEAPPSALDRYFYFLDVEIHDSLFRHVVQATYAVRPDRDKLPWLDALRADGLFLVHVSPDPFTDAAVLPPLVPALVRRCRALRPERILLVGARVYDVAFRLLVEAGLPVVDARLPYPGSGQQRRFLEAAGPLLRSRRPTSRAPSR